MTSPCNDCPILVSCHYKREKPSECNHKPAPMRSRQLRNQNVVMGESLIRYARQEQAMRNSSIGFKGDF
jgi:hypothetical protein